MITVLITGATRGLGLAAAHAAAARGAHVLLAARDPDRTAAAAADVGGEPVVLDLTSLAAVRAAAGALGHVDAVVCNAGLQNPGDMRLTEDGFEETFQVNHLAHLVLVDALLAREDPPSRVVFVGSATHDPAQRSGLPDPPDVPVAQMARGHLGGTGNAGRRRYSTSKLLTTAVTGALARDRPQTHVTCLDPGLMPSTGLSRSYPAAVARAFAALERPLSVLPFASTPARSGAWLAALALEDPPPAPSGTTIDFRGRPARISARAADPVFQDEVLAVSRELGRDVPARAEQDEAQRSRVEL